MKNTPPDDILSDSPMLLRKTRLWWSSWIKSLDIANQVACLQIIPENDTLLMRDRSVRLLPMSWQISLRKISKLRILGNVCRPVWHGLGQRKIYSYSKLFNVRVKGEWLVNHHHTERTWVTYRESVTLKNEVFDVKISTVWICLKR